MSYNLTESGRDLIFPGTLWLPQISVGLSRSQSIAGTVFTTANSFSKTWVSHQFKWKKHIFLIGTKWLFPYMFEESLCLRPTHISWKAGADVVFQGKQWRNNLTGKVLHLSCSSNIQPALLSVKRYYENTDPASAANAWSKCASMCVILYAMNWVSAWSRLFHVPMCCQQSKGQRISQLHRQRWKELTEQQKTMLI